MNKQEFIAQLERGAASLPKNPVSSAVLQHLAQSLKAGEPEWWALTQKAWEHRSFVAWDEAWSLVLNAIHYEALSDADSPLVPYFPSCGGTDEADPSSALAQFLRDAPDTFYEHLRSGERRNFSQVRAQLWVPIATIFFQSRELPYYLVEVGAGSGLGLIADLSQKFKAFSADLVSARIGLDSPALAMEDITHRRWVTAAILPDAPGFIAKLDAGIDVLLDGKRRDPNFVQFVDCAPLKAPRFIAKNIPSDDEDVGLLVFNGAVTTRMSDADYQAYAKGMADVLKPWGERAIWVEAERVRAELYSATYELRAARYVNGAPVQKVLTRFEAGADSRPKLEENVRFLYPPGARVTIEQLLGTQPKA